MDFLFFILREDRPIGGPTAKWGLNCLRVDARRGPTFSGEVKRTSSPKASSPHREIVFAASPKGLGTLLCKDPSEKTIYQSGLKPFVRGAGDIGGAHVPDQ